ncbi:MAG TPA: hypothetical protein VGK57_13980 [Candidatus Binatia bacterium]|jgi:hypothetical protein
MGTEEGLRLVSTLIGGGFIAYAAIAVCRRSLYDVDEGLIDQVNRPLAFWLSVLGMTLLGLFILGVGYRWPVVQAVFELTGHRLR